MSSIDLHTHYSYQVRTSNLYLLGVQQACETGALMGNNLICLMPSKMGKIRRVDLEC
jgi:hypothetical protein